MLKPMATEARSVRVQKTCPRGTSRFAKPRDGHF